MVRQDRAKQKTRLRILNPNPFFPNPLDDFEPKKPDFEPEIDPDYEIRGGESN